MLSQKYPESRVAELLIPGGAWAPYPKGSDRTAWEGLPEAIRARHIAAGEARLDYDWPTVLATRFLDYVRDGDRNRMQRASFGRRGALVALVLAECTEGDGRFLDDIVNGVWAICEETYWGVSAHIGVQKAGAGLPDVSEPTVDLFAAIDKFRRPGQLSDVYAQPIAVQHMQGVQGHPVQANTISLVLHELANK